MIGTMTFSSRITPQDSFPEHLENLSTEALEILNSKVHRQAELEYQHYGDAELETRFRLEFLAEELDLRENATPPPAAAPVALRTAAAKAPVQTAAPTAAPAPAPLAHA